MDVLLLDYKKKEAADDFARSIKNTGFALVKNHDIEHELIDEVFLEWQKFFTQTETEKRKHLFKRDFEIVQSGFFPTEISETAKGFTAKDLKEFYHFYPCTQDLPSIIGPATMKLRLSLIEIAKTLLKYLEDFMPHRLKENLSLPLSEMIDEKYQTLLRILHYPPLPKNIAQDSVRAAAHEDINLITLLVSPSAAGLQTLDKAGRWHDIPCEKNSITVNIGDMLEECSQGFYKATKHRVVNPQEERSNSSRYSIPLFLHPRDKVKLSDRHTAQSYRNERLRELGLL